MSKPKPTKIQLARRKNARERRASILSEGGKALYILLDAEHAKKLARLQERREQTARDVIQTLIAGAKP